MPGAIPAAVLAANVSATLAPPGMLNVPHAGEVAPTAGSTVAVRVAPPASTGAVLLAKLMAGFAGSASARVTPVAVLLPAAFATVIVYVAGVPAAMNGVAVDLVTVSCGKHALEEPAPGIWLAERLTIWKPPTELVEP